MESTNKERGEDGGVEEVLRSLAINHKIEAKDSASVKDSNIRRGRIPRAKLDSHSRLEIWAKPRQMK